MEEEKEIKMTLKKFLIIIAGIILLGLILFIIRERVIYEQDISIDLGIVTYEGTFQTKGVVVRTEQNMVTIMPIVIGKEYRNEEKFCIENENLFHLKQGQEVMITFHYRESLNEPWWYEAVMEEVEILKEKSDIEIPKDIFVKAYSSKDNVSILFDTEKSNNKTATFIITDSNELTYDYSTMEYTIRKYDPTPPKAGIIYTEDGGMAIPAYNPYPEVARISDLSTKASYQIDENGQVNVFIDFSQVYGELGEGEYTLTLSTVSSPRQSSFNANVLDYPYDTVILDISFVVDANGEIEYRGTTVH